jgi:glycosyltransferase involved in cell wall biosynthesis
VVIAKSAPVQKFMSKVVHKIESGPPAVCETGVGNLYLVRGYAFHPQKRTTGLALAVGDKTTPVDGFDDFRPDVAHEFAGRDEVGASVMSGFFASFEAAPQLAGSEQMLALELAFDDGSRERLEIGSVAFTAPPPPTGGVPVARLTICLATWNPEPAALARQVDSLIAQDFKDWVCIVSDDCSAKAIYTRIREICARDPRFHVFRNARNLGFYRNFEAAMKRVPHGSEFVGLCDQDDFWYGDKLSACLAAFKPETQLVYCDMRIVRESGEVVAPSYWTRRRNQYRDLDVLIMVNTVTGAASVFRAGLLAKLLPFPERIGDAFHDHWIACCALAGGGIEYVDRPLYDYIQHGGNVIGHATFDALPTLTNRAKRMLGGLLAPRHIRRTLAELRAKLTAVYQMEYRRLHLIAATLRLRFAAKPGLEPALAPFLSPDDWGMTLMLWHASPRFATAVSGNAELRIGSSLAMRHLSRLYVNTRAKSMVEHIRRAQAVGRTDRGARLQLPVVTDKIAPLQLNIRANAPRRVNLLLPEINFDNFFGGYMGKFNLARKLAEAGFQVRMVIVDWCDVRPEVWRSMVNRYEGLAGFFSYVEVAYCFDRKQPLDVSPHDAFIASTWWTAHIAADAMKQLAANDGAPGNPKPFTYLIQEYEPFTFPMGTLFALADQSYTFSHRAIFSTGLLEEYFREHRLGVFAANGEGADASLPFENAILSFDVSAPEIAARTRRKLLFYARPEGHAARNMFEIGLLALEQAIAGGVFGHEPWVFHGIGTSHGDIEFAAGGVLKMLGKVSLDEYKELLPQYDVGISLMYTPHPSLVPLEMAAAGMLTVTNTCLNKTAVRLSAISSNIIAAEPNVTGVLAALTEAVSRVNDAGARVRGSRVNWASGWDAAFDAKFMERLAHWLRPAAEPPAHP